MIAGFGIGHHTADGGGWLTGTTVVSAPGGAVGGVDVRGGAPGTRETDLLDPRALVGRVDAVVLTGGSAYGLAAATGVMAGLEAAGRGFVVGQEPGRVVPIVPAAVIFDLGRGGVFGHRPDAEFGRRALLAADVSPAPDPPAGCVGAGTGAMCGGLKGGFGYAEQTLEAGCSVGAAVVLNAAGSPVDPATGRLWADHTGRLAAPAAAELTALAEARARLVPLNTTIGVVLTDLALTKAEAGKVASVAHDGLARAVRPVHAMTDGDTVFCLASGRLAAASDAGARLGTFDAVLTAAAEVFAKACLAAVLAATSRGRLRSYLDLAPSARPGTGL